MAPTDWPGKMRKPMPGSPDVELVADWAAQGLILYWLERKANVPETVPVFVPNEALLRPRNWSPVRLAPVPVRVIDFNQACGQVLVAVGKTIVVVTLIEDFSVVGTFDDVVTVPGGVLLISLGQRLGAFVPAATAPAFP